MSRKKKPTTIGPRQFVDSYRRTGRTQRMLDEALEFVEPDGKPYRMAIVGLDAAHACQLLERFAEMLLRANYRIDERQAMCLQVGNTTIRFVSGKDKSAGLGLNVFTKFEDHTVGDIPDV